MTHRAAASERWGDEARRALGRALAGLGAQARGDVFIEEIQRVTVARSEGEQAPAVWRHGRGAALRCWAGGDTTFSCADGAPAAALAACLAGLGPANSATALPWNPHLATTQEAGLLPASPLEPARHFLTELALALDRLLTDLRLTLELEQTDRVTLVADEAGATCTTRWSWTRLKVVARTADRVTAHWLGGAPDIDALHRRHTAATLAVCLDRRLRGVLVKREALPVCEPSTPVLFAAGNGGIVLHEFAHQLEGDLIARGWSRWRDSVQAEPPLARSLTLWDDPNRPALRGSYHVDDEGRRGERRLLVRHGRVLGHLGDRQRAEADAQCRPGHGRRCSWREPPLPRASNLCLAAGDRDAHAVREERGVQLLIHALESGATDPRSGEMTLRVHDGEWLRDGRTVAYVAGLDLEGNVLELLGRVDRVCSDRQADDGAATCRRQGSGVPIGFYTPTFRSRGLREIR